MTLTAYRQAARQAGLELEPHELPEDALGQNSLLDRLQGLAQGPIDTVISSMARQQVRSKDKDNGKVTVKEYLTINGEFQAKNYRGVPYSQEFVYGKQNRPNIVVNTDQRFNPETGKPLRPEKILSGRSTVYTIELPKDVSKMKKVIDGYIGDNDPEAIRFYINELSHANTEIKSDDTLSYEDFVTKSYSELKDLSARSGGSRSSGYWRDKDGKIHSRDE
jgi:hypothetical protein